MIKKILFFTTLLTPFSGVYAIPPAPPLCNITAEVISIERDTRQTFFADLFILTSENANILANNCPKHLEQVLENTSLFWWELNNENPPQTPFLIQATLFDTVNSNSNYNYRLANIEIVERDEMPTTTNESLNQTDESELYLADNNELGTDNPINNLFQVVFILFIIFGSVLILRKLLSN